MQTIIVHLRHWMPLLVLLGVTVCAWEVSATPPEAVRTADTQPTLQTPKMTVNIAARRLYLYDEDAALVKTYARGGRFTTLSHPYSCPGPAHDCVECLVDSSPQPVGQE